MKAIKNMATRCVIFYKYSNVQTKVGVLMFSIGMGLVYTGAINMANGMYKLGYRQGAFERDWYEQHVL